MFGYPRFNLFLSALRAVRDKCVADSASARNIETQSPALPIVTIILWVFWALKTSVNSYTALTLCASLGNSVELSPLLPRTRENGSSAFDGIVRVPPRNRSVRVWCS